MICVLLLAMFSCFILLSLRAVALFFNIRKSKEIGVLRPKYPDADISCVYALKLCSALW